MIEIKKGVEPHELTEYKRLENATYDGMHGAILHEGSQKDVYHIVLDSLIKEQGCICAYCMKRIPEKRKKPSATIEHIKPQSISTDEDVDRQLNDVLNLNCSCLQLAELRKAALRALTDQIKKKNSNGDIKRYCQRLLKKYEEDEKKQPYVGILIYWLKKHSR